MNRLFLVALLSSVLAFPANATTSAPPSSGGGGGSTNVTVSPFQPASIGTPITATTAGATGTMPAGTTAEVQNVGAFPAYCQAGNSATGVTQSKYISAFGGQWGIATSGITQITCAGVGGTTTINMLGGSGLAIDTTGSSTSGGGTVPTGTAGSANANVMSVQGISGGTPLVVALSNAVLDGTSSAYALGVQGVNGGVPLNVSLSSLPALATGANTIGSIANSGFAINGTLPAFASTPTFNIGTAPSLTIGALPSLPNGANTIGSIGNTAFGISGTLPGFASTPTFNIGTAPTLAVTGTFWQTTQPVSVASLPLPPGAATAGNQTLAIGPVAPGAAATNSQLGGCQYNSPGLTLAPGYQAPVACDSTGRQIVSAIQGAAGLASGGWFTKLTDGANTAAVKAASTPPAATDPALNVTISPNSAISAGLSKGPINSAPAVTNGAYTANMALGNMQPVSVFRTTAQPSGTLNSIDFYSKGGITQSVAIYAFVAAKNTSNTLYSTCADHTAFVLNSLDLPYLIPGFPITLAPSTLAGTTQTSISSPSLNITISNQDTTPTTNIYVCAVTLGTPTPASVSDVGFGYTISQD